MQSLLYSAAQDPYHTIFRILCILQSHESGMLMQEDSSFKIELERMQIYDFYVCFPWTLASLAGSNTISNFIKSQNLLKNKYVNNEYEKIPSSQVMFFNMNPIQCFSIESLVVKNIIDYENYKNGYLKLNSENVQTELIACISNYIKKHQNLFDFIVNYLSQLPLKGRSGLKDRSRLKEYRYDIV